MKPKIGSMTTLADALTNLEAAQSAYRRALDVRAVGFEGRTVQRQDIAALRAEINYWQRQVDQLTATTNGTGTSRVRSLILRSS